MTVETAPSHVIAQPDVTTWLAEHGVNINQVLTAVIRVDREPGAREIGAWLDVEFYLHTARGEVFADWGKGEPEVATGKATIPLRSWPPLQPAK